MTEERDYDREAADQGAVDLGKVTAEPDGDAADDPEAGTPDHASVDIDEDDGEDD
jgi:hypothetical protein